MDDEITIEAIIHNDKNTSKNKKSSKKRKNTKKKTNATKKQVVKKAALSAAAGTARDKLNAKKAIKARKKQRIKVLTTLILIIGALILLLSSKLFYIKHIDVNVNSKLSKEEIISISGVTTDINIFALNKLNAKRNLLENSYVQDVTITRDYPNTITIDIKEKVPNFMIQFANSYIYINNQGYMLEISTEPLNLPSLLGITTDLSNVKPGDRLIVDDLKKFNKLIQIMDVSRNFEINELITRIDITDPLNYTLYLDGEGKTVYLGDAIDLNTKILPLTEILNQTKDKSGEIFLDMDLNEQNPRFRESYQ